ncbi:hypothetical protein CDV55_103682 [Aspergillus turcosus]|nr:hypothetical protein CDV55_103682 [Aspergillus turcosus]
MIALRRSVGSAYPAMRTVNPLRWVSEVEIGEDEITRKLDECFLGTIVFDVRHLNPVWKKGSNRSLNQKHVEHLKEEYMTNIRRHAIEDRLWVTMSKDDFNAYLTWIFRNRNNNEDPNPAQLEELQKQSKLRTTELLEVEHKVPQCGCTPLSVPGMAGNALELSAVIDWHHGFYDAAYNWDPVLLPEVAQAMLAPVNAFENMEEAHRKLHGLPGRRRTATSLKNNICLLLQDISRLPRIRCAAHAAGDVHIVDSLEEVPGPIDLLDGNALSSPIELSTSQAFRVFEQNIKAAKGWHGQSPLDQVVHDKFIFCQNAQTIKEEEINLQEGLIRFEATSINLIPT